jgi:hypothetical protein
MGSTFTGFTGSLTGTTTPRTLVFDGNEAVDAAFTLNGPYTLSLTKSGTGAGTIQASPAGPYYYGTSVTIWANASMGSTFTGFTGSLTGTVTPQILVMDENKAVTANFTITSGDTSPPYTSCTLSGTLGQNTWYTSNVTVILIAADNLSGVNTTYYRIDGGSWQKYTVTLTLSSNGIHLFDYYSTDMLGNTESTKSVTIKIDKTTPSLSIIKPEKGFLYINDMKIYYVGPTIVIGGITVKVNTSDTESGIAKVEFYVDNRLKSTDNTTPYKWKWNEKIYCKHKLKTITYNQAGQTKTAEMDVWIFKW